MRAPSTSIPNIAISNFGKGDADRRSSPENRRRLRRNSLRRRRCRHGRPYLAGGFAFDPDATCADHRRQGPAGDRMAVGPDAPPAGSRPPGPCDDRHFGGRLRALGPQGQGVRAADLAHPGRPDPRRASPPMLRCSAMPSRISARCAERALACKASGYTAQKWFIRHGPMSGHEGMRKNVALVRGAARGAGRRLRHHDRLLAEPQPRLRRRFLFPHRGVPAALDRGMFHARPHRQPCEAESEDPDTAGRRRARIYALGLQAVHRKGCARCSAARHLLVRRPQRGLEDRGLRDRARPHRHSARTFDADRHPLRAAQSPIHSPYQEYLVKWNAIHMHFLKNPLWPVDGSIAFPSAPGANMDLDSAKIEREEDVRV